jgi:hypothetical protein
MKSKLIIGILILALAAASIIIIIQHHKIKTIDKQTNPYFLEQGESISYFDLVGKDNEKINVSKLKNNRRKVIFIFKTPCAHCNGNILYWNRMAKILGKDVDIYGIIPGDRALMIELYRMARLYFKLYVPVDAEKFKQKMKVSMNLGNTILYYDNRVIMNISGDLDGESYTALLKSAGSFQESK